MSNNHFEFFGIPVSFYPDTNKLREIYYTYSKEFHPDYFGQASAAEQEESLKKSTQNTNAYKTLSSFERRLPYVLELKGTIQEGEKPILDPEFLMEMMELNEEISEAREGNSSELEKYEQRVLQLESDFNNNIKNLCETWDNSQDDALLTKIKDLYYKRKYLKRLQENLAGEQED